MSLNEREVMIMPNDRDIVINTPKDQIDHLFRQSIDSVGGSLDTIKKIDNFVNQTINANTIRESKNINTAE